jgi:indole-3-glycerol phosphate synthase / phosphoribosylanthranilate isomerase
MVPGTPRAVTLAQAEQAAGAAGGAARVAVFRDAEASGVAAAARALELGAVQLHGAEDAAYIENLRRLLPEAVEIWATGAVGDTVPAPRPGADRMLFDTAIGGRSGGTGIAFDWDRIRGRAELGTGLLAGGLRPENAGEAARLGAYGLDVCSGVEAAPGRKDPARVAAFFAALRPPVRGEAMPC